MRDGKTRRAIAATLNPKHLELIVLPTEQCNFRCTYCYEDFTIGKMKADVVEGIKRLMSRRFRGLDSFNLSWFGGEPLNAKDVVLDISSHATTLARQHGVAYSGGITTNGYLLTSRTFRELSDCGIRNYQVTLDGWGRVHDRTRRRADGGPTFERIWKHLLGMRDSSASFRVLLRVHLQPESTASVRELAEKLKGEFSADSRFDTLFKAVGNWGGPNSGAFATLDGTSAREFSSELTAGWRRARGEPEPEESSRPYVCYASRPNSFVLRADGSIGKCTVKLSDPRNQLGRVKPDGTLELARDRLDPWIRGYKNFDLEALSCPAMRLPAEVLPVLG